MSNTATATPIDAGQVLPFLEALFAERDSVLIRPIESWVDRETGRKHARTIYKATRHILSGPDSFRLLAKQLPAVAEAERANLFFGVCPRFGGGGKFDLAWQIRAVRALWIDIDNTTVDAVLAKCDAAGLPRPSIVVHSGNGVHVYWILAEPFLIDDASDPPAVETEWSDGQDGKRKPRKYFIADGKRVYLDRAANAPRLSAKAQRIQDVLQGIAAEIGGDHTFDLSRLLRMPGTLNRKDQRNGREPTPCVLVECEPDRRYPLAEFERFAAKAPDYQRRQKVASVQLPSKKRTTPKRLDKFNDHVTACMAAPKGNRSAVDFHLCCFAIRSGMGRDEVWAAVANVGKFSEGGERDFDRTWEAAAGEVREQIYTDAERAANRRHQGNGSTSGPGSNGHTDHPPGGEAQPAEPDKRPRIEITPEELDVNDQALDALAADPTIYQRGGRLMHVVRVEGKSRSITREADSPLIVPIPTARLRERLADAAYFYKRTVSADGEEKITHCHPPDWCVKGAEARGEFPGIREIVGIAETPTLLRDGSILATPGYDPSTGLLYVPNADFPAVPDSPTIQELADAIALIDELFIDFPFGTAEHKAGAVAALITPIVRHAFAGPAPLFLIDASTAGSGKSLASDVIGITATGRRMPRSANPSDDKETRKLITSVAISADALMLIDNVDGQLGSPALDAALTGETWRDRILGSSTIVTLPLAAVWYATGNNVVLARDTARRTVHVRLEPMVESPEERTGFRHADLLDWVQANRGRIVAACLTIVRHYLANGRKPPSFPPWGSFEAWSGLVRAAVVAAGWPDPCANRKEFARRTDSEAAALRAFLMHWQDVDPTGDGLTTAAILRAIEPRDGSDHLDEFRTAVRMLCRTPASELPSVNSLSRRLTKFVGRIASGSYLDHEETQRGFARWVVRRMEESR